MKKSNAALRLIGVASLFAVSGCDRLSKLSYLPKTTPDEWLNSHPFWKIKLGSFEFFLMEPSSTLWVYSLAILAVVVGVYFLRIRDNHKSRFWWGIALVLWGIQAFLGGTDYQALSYELKCAGKEYCSYISWVEIYYSIFSILSVNAMVFAVGYSSAEKNLNKLRIYLLLNSTVYICLCVIGALIPNRFLVSFELLVLFSTPGYLIAFTISALRYARLKEKMDLYLMFTWLLLAIVMATYYLYLGFEMAAKLWLRGIWFNENDVLHIGLILWMLFIAIGVAKKVRDNEAVITSSLEDPSGKRTA